VIEDMGMPQPYITIVAILGGMIALQNIVFTIIFLGVAIKTRWEIKEHNRNGLMVNILALAISSAIKWFSAFILIMNGIFRTLPDYPLWITPSLLLIDFIAASWLVVTMYNMAYIIMNEKEEDHEQSSNLPSSQPAPKEPG
jgi:hypothetical protein